MVIVLKKDISETDKKRIKDFLGEKNFKTNEVPGEEATIIAAVGHLKIDPSDVNILPGVEKVIPISKGYKLASREFNPLNSIVELSSSFGQKIRIGGQRIVSIAGPCAVEERERMFEIAREVSRSGACMLRGGAYKPRTSPYSFQGLGEEGVKMLKEAGDKYGLPVVTEIVASEHLSIMKKYGVDVLQIGARNMQNFDLLKEVGKSKIPVILKRGLCATLEEWLMSAEYLLSSGSENVILCERGIRTYEKATRNTLDLSAVPVLRGMTHLPIIVDPSHAVGIRDKIAPMALAAIAAGADGVIVEVHNCPEKAMSDGPQALLPEMFDKLMHDIEALAPVLGKNVVHVRSNSIENLQEKIRDKQEKKVCAYSGKRGAYAEQAVDRYFDGDVSAKPVDSFREIFKAVLSGQADYGMLPIENSLAGSVYQNYDNLSRFDDVSIVGALHLRIQHALLAPRGTSINSIKKVYSHPQAFAQCSKFLTEHKWEKIDAVSTATGAKIVSDYGTKDNAAIASTITAKYYNLDILQEDIQDDPRDYTRFVIISANDGKNSVQSETKEPNMATFMFSIENRAGALYECLGIFQKYGLSLSRLESRPRQGEPWHYWFYVDAELSGKEQKSEEYVHKVLDELKKSVEEIRLLGVYAEAGYSI
ncbi:MAG: 3-deoxy-7-phosphoheptulonate synthase [Treponema sp.]|nr:3-deoxy-7-phosphoheptulonate synthase [Treponema sp.]